jgi:hypothetical protein
MAVARQSRRSSQAAIAEHYDRLTPADFFRKGPPIVLWTQTTLKKEVHTKPKAADHSPTRPKQVQRAAQVSPQLGRRKELQPNRIDLDFDRTSHRRSHKQSTWFNSLKSSHRALKPLTYSQQVSPYAANKSPFNALIKCESIRGVMESGGGKQLVKRLTNMPKSLQSSPRPFKPTAVERLETPQPKTGASEKGSPSITVVLRRTNKAFAPQQVNERKPQFNGLSEQLPHPSVHKAPEQKKLRRKMPSHASQSTVKSRLLLRPWSSSSEELTLLQ